MTSSRPLPPRLSLVTIAVFCLFCVSRGLGATTATDGEMQAAHAWAAAHIAPDADAPAVTAPFSFSFHGEPSAQLLPNWTHDRAHCAG